MPAVLLHGFAGTARHWDRVLAFGVDAVTPTLNDASAVAANPTSLVLNLGTDVADVKAVWTDVRAVCEEDLGVKL